LKTCTRSLFFSWNSRQLGLFESSFSACSFLMSAIILRHPSLRLYPHLFRMSKIAMQMLGVTFTNTQRIQRERERERDDAWEDMHGRRWMHIDWWVRQNWWSTNDENSSFLFSCSRTEVLVPILGHVVWFLFFKYFFITGF